MEEGPQKSGMSSFVKGVIVAFISLACGIVFGLITCMVLIILPILWLILFFVKTPYFASLVKGLSWAACEMPSWLGGNSGNPDGTACALHDFLVEAKKQGLDDLINGEFDCSIFPPDLWYYCSDTITLTDDSAIPKDKQYLIAAYRAAGEYFNVPWQVLAALHATNTNFGEENCTNKNDKREGGGQFDFSKKEWDKFKVDAGEERKREFQKDGHICSEHKTDNSKKGYAKNYVKIKSKKEINDYRKDPEDKWFEGNAADPLDAVDSIFTMARMLDYYGGGTLQSTWSKKDYTGGVDNGCNNINPSVDGRIYSYTGAIGYNSLLKTTPEFDALYAYWSRKIPYRGKTLTKDFKAIVNKYGDPPSTMMPGEKRYRGAQDLILHAPKNTFVSEKELNKIIDVLGPALDIQKNILDKPLPNSGGRTIRKNFTNLVHGESAGTNNYMVIMFENPSDINNGSYLTWSRGLVQFIPGTFEVSRVPGYDNLYNPIDNLMAGMNRMRNSKSMAATQGYDKASFNGKFYGLWPRGSGWSPGGFTNPYSEGKHSSDSAEYGDRKYEGTYIEKDQLEHPITHGVWQNYGTPKNHSNCYVATVWTWYQAIVKSGYANGNANFGGGDSNSPPGSFIWPTKNHGLSRGFCVSASVCGDKHDGLDIAVGEGTSIIATASGKIVADPLAQPGGYSAPLTNPTGYGCTVFMSHNGGYFSRYAHILKSTRKQQIGDAVAQGEHIVNSGASTMAGREGCRGGSSGAHLHFEIRKGSSAQDPLKLLP